MSGHLALVGIHSSCHYRAGQDCEVLRNLRILDALHLMLIGHCVYYYLVINYANVSALTEIVWSFKVSSYCSPPCSSVVL